MEILLERQHRELNILRQKRHRQRAHTAVPSSSMINQIGGMNAEYVYKNSQLKSQQTGQIPGEQIAESTNNQAFFDSASVSLLQKAYSMKLASERFPKNTTQTSFSHANCKNFI